MTRLLNVWHIGAWNRNVGDWALAYQMHRLLNEQGASRGIAFRFHQIDSQRTFFYPELVDQMNDEADLIVIGGGGLIFARPEDRSVSGWSFNIPPADLARLRPPIVVHGIGYNRFAYDTQPFPPATAPHLRQLQDKAVLFSVRNHGTRRQLIERYGLDPNRLDVVPDAGICLYDRPIAVPGLRRDVPVVALNWAGDRPHQRYPPPAEENAREFLARTKAALRRLVDERGVQIMFLPHLVSLDTDMYDEFADGFPTGTIVNTHRAVPYLYPPPGEMMYAHIPFFTNLFRQADVILGMRLHTCILAFGAGTRFIPLGSHPKVHYFADDVGASRYRLRLCDPQTETADTIRNTVAHCLDDVEYRDMLRRSLQQQLDRLRRFHEHLLDVIAPSVAVAAAAKEAM